KSARASLRQASQYSRSHFEFRRYFAAGVLLLSILRILLDTDERSRRRSSRPRPSAATQSDRDNIGGIVRLRRSVRGVRSAPAFRRKGTGAQIPLGTWIAHCSLEHVIRP